MSISSRQIQQAQIQPLPQFGYDASVAEALSAAGWTYQTNTAQWRKGEHRLSVEGLHDMLLNFHGARNRILKAIGKGVVGFKFDVQQIAGADDVEFVVTFRTKWPDAVTRLGAIDA